MAKLKSDIEIARAAKIKPIAKVLKESNIPDETFAFSPMGRHIAKLNLEYIDSLKEKKSKLILVTAITPTPAGEGKTTTSVGLCDGLNKIGKQSIVCLREPSLGPSFGMKGGAVWAVPEVSKRAKAYSFQLKIRQKIAVAAIPVVAWGKTTFRKDWKRE